MSEHTIPRTPQAALRTLAEFARSAPGRLPERVEVALQFADKSHSERVEDRIDGAPFDGGTIRLDVADLLVVVQTNRELRAQVAMLQKNGTAIVLASRHLKVTEAARPGTLDRVMRFTRWMALKMKRNESKGVWTKYTLSELMKLLRAEVEELDEELQREADPVKVASEAADVGNFAMFIADVAKGLDTDPPLE